MYTYTPGNQIDALTLLAAKGLLETPTRPRQHPGTYLLDLHSHRLVGEDGVIRPAPDRNIFNAAPASTANGPSAQAGVRKGQGTSL